MSGPDKQRCETCAWFDYDPADKGPRECRRGAPVVMVNEPEGVARPWGRWPHVNPTSWCGEWRGVR